MSDETTASASEQNTKTPTNTLMTNLLTELVAAIEGGIKSGNAEGVYYPFDWEGRKELKDLLVEAIRTETVRAAMMEAMAGRVAAAPASILDGLFERSGHIVKSSTSSAIDSLVTELILEDKEKFKALMSNHIQANLDTYVVSAIVKIFLMGMTGELNRSLGEAGGGVAFMIRNAFMNAKVGF